MRHTTTSSRQAGANRRTRRPPAASPEQTTAPRPTSDEATVTTLLGDTVVRLEDALERKDRALASVEPVLLAAKVVVLHAQPTSEADRRLLASLRKRLDALEAA